MAVKLLVAVLVAAAGLWLTTRGLPGLVVRVGRLLGLSMRPTPLTARRLERFRRIRRGHVCFLVVTTAFVLSLFLELLVNHRPLYIRFEGERGTVTRFPALMEWLDAWVPFVDLAGEARAVAEDFGLSGSGEVPYRDYARWVADPAELEGDARRIEAELEADAERHRRKAAETARRRGEAWDAAAGLPAWKEAEHEARRAQAQRLRGLRAAFEAGRARVLTTLHAWSPREQLLDLAGAPPHPPFSGRPGVPLLGTDFEGKENLSQLLYGFRVGFAFAVLVAFLGFALGIVVGAVMGWFGGWVDILVQRLVEIWSAIPFLFVLMIVGSIYTPSFGLLVALLVVLTAWIGITWTMRGEYYREKARDYVQAARALGVGTPKILFRHILPNALVPVVTFMPFAIVGFIDTLVALDFLGFGLPPDVPSWGRLLRQGAENVLNAPWLVYLPIAALAGTLFCVVLVGEAVREAFDPKLYARLR